MRRSRWVLVVLALVALAAAGVAANLYLLGLTDNSGELVGRLSPRAALTPTTTPRQPVPTTTSDEGSHPDD